MLYCYPKFGLSSKFRTRIQLVCFILHSIRCLCYIGKNVFDKIHIFISDQPRVWLGRQAGAHCLWFMMFRNSALVWILSLLQSNLELSFSLGHWRPMRRLRSSVPFCWLIFDFCFFIKVLLLSRDPEWNIFRWINSPTPSSSSSVSSVSSSIGFCLFLSKPVTRGTIDARSSVNVSSIWLLSACSATKFIWMLNSFWRLTISLRISCTSSLTLSYCSGTWTMSARSFMFFIIVSFSFSFS